MIIKKLKSQNEILLEKNDKDQDNIERLKKELNRSMKEIDDLRSENINISLNAKQWLTNNSWNSIDAPNQTSRFGNGYLLECDSKETLSLVEKLQEKVKSRDQTISDLNAKIEKIKTQQNSNKLEQKLLDSHKEIQEYRYTEDLSFRDTEQTPQPERLESDLESFKHRK